ncbi:alpha/beta-hydrolase family protein [Nocardia carnea]|uniref:Alpha/beta-hydrolase family protein n=1 Tax=Nocardia carnea TaxID=37328 RepID=A0ABW7TIF7_9NOCA|nr:alpha/beta-hydrolase family protein [Nocardia carnea]
MKHITPAAAQPLWSPAPLLLRPFDRAGTAVAAPTIPPATSGTTAPGDLRRLARRGFPVGVTLAVALGTILSLAPGLLPRSAAAQAVLTSVLVVTLLGIARLTGSLFSRRRPNAPGRHLLRRKPRSRIAGTSGTLRTDGPSPTTAVHTLSYGRPGILPLRRDVRTGRLRRSVSDRFAGVPTVRHLMLATAGAGVVASVVHAASWQNTLRDAMGVARIGPEYWAFWAVGSLVLTIVLVAAGSGAGRLLRRIGWSRGVAMAVVAALPVAFFGIPGIAAASGGGAESGLVQPAATTRSGSAESLVSWDSLGREGQRFVTNGPAGAVRVYVGLRSAPDPASRAELAVRELDRAGGFDRAHLVIAVPTGSGWVDARALRGFGDRFGADFAVTALQYSHLPSWATFVLGRDSAAASARALFTAIEQHAATLPDPPRLHLYGQSLGALGGSAVFAGAAEQNRRVCSVLWSGMPGGGGREAGARTAVLANTSDPVVHWSPDLLWRPPNLSGARRDAPAPGWLPVVSFVQTTADLLGALSAPPGHGHRYDTDQGTALPGCA